MLFLPWTLLYWIAWSCMYDHVTEGACEYPSDLRGEWYSTSNGLLNFNNDSIDNLKTNVHATPTTFTCDTIQGSQYISKSEIQIFTNQKYTVYLCMTFSRISDTKYTFTYNADIDPTTNQRLFGILTQTSSASVTYAQACNLTSSLPVGTQELLIRKDAINGSGISCPSVIQSIFDVTLEQSCNNTVLYGTADTTQLQYNYSSCVTTSLSFSANGTFTCVYYVTSGSNYYLTVLNTDSHIDESTYYRFICYVISSTNEVLHATYAPRICQPNQTSTYVYSLGVHGVFLNRYPTVSSSDSSSEIPVAAIVAIVIIFIIIVIYVIVIIITYVIWTKKRSKVEDCNNTALQQTDTKQETSEEDDCEELDDKLIPTTGNESKRKKRKRRKKDKRKHDASGDRRKSSVSRKVILNEDLNTVMEESRPDPEWKKRWETFQDPVSRGCPPDDTSLRGPGNSRPGTARSVTTVWVMPDKQEETEVMSAWDKVSVLWNSVSRKNPARQYNPQFEFTNNVHM